MIMIIGGAFQGKGAYAEKEYPQLRFADGASIKRDEIGNIEGIYGLHALIRKEMKAGKDVTELAEELIEKNPDIVIISEEVGYGVVPMDAFDREYREKVGRICTKLAAYSEKVIRVVCGIGTVIKDA